MKVKDVMTQDVFTVQAKDPIWKAAQVMKEANIGAIPVQNGEEVVGIITDRDIAIRDVANQQTESTCEDIMSTELISCEADTDINKVSELMSQNQVRRLPVMEDGKLVGMVALADLATDERFQDEAQDALEDISEPNS